MKTLQHSRFFIFILILLIVLLPSGSNIQSASALYQDGLAEDDSSLGDAEIYAKNMGVSLDEALRRFHLQEVAGELDAKLSVNEPETFAGLWVEHSPEFRIIAQFTQDADQKIKLYVTEEIVDVLSAQTAEVSLVELQNAQKELISSLGDLEIPTETEINIYDNKIKLFIAETDRMHFDDVLQSGILKLTDYTDVVIVPELGKPQSNIYGGLTLLLGNGTPWCTTGFSVEHSQGTRGVTTAAHCSDNAYNAMYYGGTILPIGGRLKIGSDDVEWLLTPGFTVTNQFKSGNIQGGSDIRRVTGTLSRDNQVIGGFVCKYGWKSGYTCGYISSKSFSSIAPNNTPTFIRVNNTAGYPNLSSGGDSGGPWFNGNTAYGIHHGEPGDDQGDAIYMAINYINDLGVSVVVAPRFADVPWDYWAWQDIERLYNSSITAGCGTNPLIYCPEGNLTRAEMSIFLLKGIHGSSYTPPPVGSSTGFDDVPISYWAAAWIKQFAAEGITAGCSVNPPLFCPDGLTTPAQMAVFLLKSKHGSTYTPPPVGNSTGFYDVPVSHWAAAWIKQEAAEGISSGCGGGYFCPESNLTRAQMAGLLVRTFNLP